MIELLNIDCLTYMKTLKDKAFDLCLTDPPYGVNLNYKTYKDTEENWFNLMNAFIPEIRRVAKMVIMPSCQIKRLEWFYKNFPPDWLMCWHKGSTGCAAYIGFNDWEPHVVYGKTNNQLYMHDYFSITPNEKLGNYGHPCPKPLRWATWLLKRSLPDGGKVIDPFIGSGTTAIACHNMGHDLVGCEIDESYFKSALERLERHKKQFTLFGEANDLPGHDKDGKDKEDF